MGLFQRQGGKWKQRKQVFAKFLPKSEYSTYVEPFLGGGNIALESPIVNQMIAGDTDDRVIDIFSLVKELNAEDIKNLDFKADKELFRKLRNFEPKSDIEKLYRLLYLMFHSHPKNFANSMISHGTTGFKFKKDLDKIKTVLDNYVILRKDYKYLISEYDSPTTFFYLDPPYHSTDTTAYQTGNIDHEQLANILRNIKGKFLLSNSDNPFIRNLYKGYNITSFMSKQSGVITGTKEVSELLISNY